MIFLPKNLVIQFIYCTFAPQIKLNTANLTTKIVSKCAKAPLARSQKNELRRNDRI